MRYWLNGKYLPDSKARISLLDRGLLFGDSLYEVIRFYRHRLFLVDEHLNRLFREAETIELPRRFGEKKVAEAIEGLVARSDEANGLILLHWTRGEGPRQLAPPPGLRGNLFAARIPLPSIPRALYESGVSLITHPDARWHGVDLKSTNLLASVLARREAVRRGAYEAVLHRGRGEKARLTEGTSSSFFLVREGRVITPAARGLLPGITRSIVIRVAGEEGIPLEERKVYKGEITLSEEAFLTATSSEILPVREIDGKPLASPVPGPVTKRLMKAFARFRQKRLRRTPPAR